MSSSKKYKLFKTSGKTDGNRPVCAFYTSPDGCRNGDKCSFRHGAPQPSAAEISETASVISSEESETEARDLKKSFDNQPVKSAPEALNEPLSGKGKKRKAKANNNAGDDLFANPKEKDHAPSPNKKMKSAENPKSATQPKVTKPQAKTGTTPASLVADFRNLISKLPVASFSIPGIGGDKEKATKNKNAPKEQPPVALSNEPQDVLPISTDVGQKWVKAVKSCRSHERYSNSFDFTRCKEINQEAGIASEWIKAKPFGSWCKTNPQAIAIDCEMCETQDPLSGAKNPKALCRMSVVNAENPEEVLLDTLVKPSWPVTDHRTRINGISKEDLDQVEFTLRHAQAFMMALCSEETVIVGHAVQNDLAALNMEHYCIADSSFLFFAKDSSSASVSLKDLAASVLKVEMPDTHDSVNDARKALECVLHWVNNDGEVEPIERTAKNNGNQLFVHRIPKQCKTHHLTNMFVKHTAVEPSSVDDVEFSGDHGKTHVTFRSARHASLAFDTLEGTAEADKTGRMQKKVYLRNGDYVRVRKMVRGVRGGTPHKTPTK